MHLLYAIKLPTVIFNSNEPLSCKQGSVPITVLYLMILDQLEVAGDYYLKILTFLFTYTSSLFLFIYSYSILLDGTILPLLFMPHYNTQLWEGSCPRNNQYTLKIYVDDKIYIATILCLDF